VMMIVGSLEVVFLTNFLCTSNANVYLCIMVLPKLDVHSIKHLMFMLYATSCIVYDIRFEAEKQLKPFIVLGQIKSFSG